MKVSSITDVITNSSTEVFVYQKSSQEFKDLCEFLGPELSKEFETYDTLEDIWNKIDSGDYYPGLMYSNEEQGHNGNSDWEGPDIDPFDYNKSWDLKNSMDELIEKGIKTKREIFDFFSPLYEGALDVAYYDWATDCGSEPEIVEKINKFYELKHIEKIKELTKLYKPGDIVYYKIDTSSFDEEFKKFYSEAWFLAQVTGVNPENEYYGLEINLLYGRDLKNWDTIEDGIGLKRGFWNGFLFKNPCITGIILDSLRKATQEEESEFKENLQKSGLIINKETGEYENRK